MSARRIQPIRPMQRAFAAVCIAVLLALGVFGANGQWHGALHGADHGPTSDVLPEHGDGCAVDLFASGVSVPLEVPSAVAQPVVAATGRLEAARELWLAEPEFRLRPGRGPPRV